MLLVVRRYRRGSSKCSKAFWAPLMVLTTSPEVAWIYSQESLCVKTQTAPKSTFSLGKFSQAHRLQLDVSKHAFWWRGSWKENFSLFFSFVLVLVFFALSCVNFDFRKLPDHCNHCSCPSVRLTKEREFCIQTQRQSPFPSLLHAPVWACPSPSPLLWERRPRKIHFFSHSIVLPFPDGQVQYFI